MLLTEALSRQKIAVPEYTWNAYDRKLNEVLPRSTPETESVQSVAQVYSDAITDEKVLFRANAAPPLVQERRKVRLHPRSQSRYQNARTTPRLELNLTMGPQLGWQQHKSKNPRHGKGNIVDNIQIEYPNIEQPKSISRYKLAQNQKKESERLASGSSRHIALSNKNSHEECKLVYQYSRDQPVGKNRAASESPTQVYG